MTPSHASATLRPVFSGTYPCIPFGRQRIRHPGAKPGSWRLDGDGIADACQFATCWKEESSEMGTSVANTRFFFMSWDLFRYPLQEDSFFFFSIYLKIQKTLPEGRGSGCPACSYIPAFLFCARGAYYSHMFTHANACCTPSLWTCEEKKDRGTEKGGKPLRILLLCAACKLSWC